MSALQSLTMPRGAFESARTAADEVEPQPLAPARWDWTTVRRVLIVRLRSLGDTVLATPTIYALRRFLPQAEIDLLLEDWVAPLLDGSPDVSRIITVKRGSTLSRLALVASFAPPATMSRSICTAARPPRCSPAHRERATASAMRVIVSAACIITPRRLPPSCGERRRPTRSSNNSRCPAGRAFPSPTDPPRACS
jgi:hypothetical protein